MKHRPKLAHQCKLCKLLHTHPDFWTEIHSKVLKEGYSKSSVRKWANEKIEILNANMKEDEERLVKFSDNNFQRHFSKHNDYEMQQTLHRQKILADNSRLRQQQGFSDSEVALVEEFNSTIEDNDIADYVSLSNMIADLEKRFKDYNKYLKERDEQGKQKKKLSIGEIQTYQKSIESFMRLKLDLAKLRNSSAVAGSAIESAVEYTVSCFVEIMMEVTEEAQSILASEIPGSSVPSEVSNLIRGKIADSMKGQVPDIIQRVSQDFNIK